jgi:hypothetical protein
MEKQGRTLKDFLMAFKKEFINIVDFLDKKTFHRDEIYSVVKNACMNVEASEFEQGEIEEVLDLSPVNDIKVEEDSKVVQFIPQVDNNETLIPSTGDVSVDKVIPIFGYDANNINDDANYEQSSGESRGKQRTKTSTHYNSNPSDKSGNIAA